jgi:hypothetical protein
VRVVEAADAGTDPVAVVVIPRDAASTLPAHCYVIAEQSASRVARRADNTMAKAVRLVYMHSHSSENRTTVCWTTHRQCLDRTGGWIAQRRQ